MAKWDIAILTEGTYLAPPVVDDYVQNVLTEQLLVQNALEARGLKVTRVDWRDQKFDWHSTQAVLFREIWDYFHRFSEYFHRFSDYVHRFSECFHRLSEFCSGTRFSGPYF